MPDESIEQRVIEVFAKFRKIPPEDVSMDTTFEQLGLDSLDGLNLIFELEEEFGIIVPDDKVQSMKSVRDAVDGIEWLIAHPEAQQPISTPSRPAGQDS